MTDKRTYQDGKARAIKLMEEFLIKKETTLEHLIEAAEYHRQPMEKRHLELKKEMVYRIRKDLKSLIGTK